MTRAVSDSGEREPSVDGVLVVDKPQGWTSHDVVARMRSLLGTRRVGHAGTLDPMATGVLVVGVGRATRLLGHISGHGKRYTATIRLGWSTVTDDAWGERLDGASPLGLDPDALIEGVGALTGAIMQRPSAVSAIKVDGRRAHDRVRSGEQVELPARPVLVSVFDILDRRPVPQEQCLDLDVVVECSSGTYVRALARDLGAGLGVGGHLTALRRLRVGGFEVAEARTLESLTEQREREGRIEVMGLDEAAASAFPMLSLDPAGTTAVSHGRPIDLTRVWLPYRDLAGEQGDPEVARSWAEHVEPHAVFDSDGRFLALVAPNADGTTRYLAVFAAA